MTIGLELICKYRDVEYKKLAEQLGISSPTIMGWLSKKRPIPKSRLEQLSEILNEDEAFIAKDINTGDKILFLELEANRLRKSMED
ncbi:helix-turn-helix domain-containing protein [Paenibacillus polymyxa]|uniref:HTH cro/C1-type domain-containing protein n=1 Tax=Paenibacillus polymyxa TaxID=1406 RepID=A0A378XZP2_PAEPO|nr:hypothetical protein [Paenibacillus polymyxa]MBE7896223.1 hypothetical protein [Paenibacillus polymyxa]MBG9765846.1 hypothetical protein [Paenibacillus polymyxa]MCC3256752.1 helix-turn-helix domain-containing protein [Paenibacillus polymyxa]QPK54761.1 helix-turn-helix domain-containing protein [Paenibacillus polymyxa]QPK59852.1 helix-turn-helix domain-containing protein [Paenibacillus polymyxa]